MKPIRKPIKTYNQMLSAYEDSCLSITESYCSEMDTFTEDSVRALCSLFQSYLNIKGNVKEEKSELFAASTQDSSQQSQNSSAVLSDISKNNSSAKIAPHINIFKPKNQPPVHQMIEADPKNKAKISTDFLLMEDEDSEEESSTKAESSTGEFKNKNIAEIIIQSQKKVMEKIENKNKNMVKEC